MPKSLGEIPNDYPIVEPEAGTINTFFRFRWEELRVGFQSVPSVGRTQELAQTAAIPTTAVYTTKSEGLYRVSYYLRRTVNDGVSSSAQVTLGWIESGVPLTEVETAVTEAGVAEQSFSKVVWADSVTDLTFSVAYASNTPAKMTYRIDVVVEQLTL
jgi:hypothetical protein